MGFKIGDKVKIIGNNPRNTAGEHHYQIGEIVIVKGLIQGNLALEVSNFNHSFQTVLMLDVELVKKTRKKRIKIGDRVRIIANNTPHYYCDWKIKPVFVKIKALKDERGQYRTGPIEGAEIGNNMTWQVLLRSDFELAPILLPTLEPTSKKKAKKGKKEKDNFECDFCSKELNTGDELEFSGDTYCQDCYDEKIGYCEGCQESVLSEILSEVQIQSRNRRTDYTPSMVCDSCIDKYEPCEDCHRYFNSDIMIQVRGNHSICSPCFESGNYFSCENCGEVDHNDNRYNNGGGNYCETCFDHNDRENDDDSDSEYIHSYDYKPEPTFYRGDNHDDKLFMGIELELEVGEGSRSEVAEQILKDPLYCKSDGSIDYGFEIVTHPCTMAYHKKQMKWDDMLAKLIKAKCKSHDTSTCGLHIHVSKKALSHIEAIRLGIFVNLNCENFETLARRTQSHYSKFKFIKKGRESNKQTSKEKGEYLNVINNSDRYEALNYQNHSTIEFRLYKGTLKYHTLISTIELTHAVCYFVKQVDSTLNLVDKEKGWQLFMDFVKKNCKTYPNLIEYLQAKELFIKTDNPVSQESEAIEV